MEQLKNSNINGIPKAYYELAKQFKDKDNSGNYKEAVIGSVKSVKPLVVTLSDGAIEISIDNGLLVLSEAFNLRCNIDKSEKLSQVNSLLEDAKSITETHSQGGAPCNMPNAIAKLSDAIANIKDEVMNLKCELKPLDRVVLAPSNLKDVYILVERI